ERGGGTWQGGGGGRRLGPAGRQQEGAGVDAHAGRARADAGGGRDRRVVLERRARVLLRGDRRGVAGEPGGRARTGRAAQPPATGGDSRRADVGRGRARHVRPRGGQRDLRRCPAAATL